MMTPEIELLAACLLYLVFPAYFSYYFFPICFSYFSNIFSRLWTLFDYKPSDLSKYSNISDIKGVDEAKAELLEIVQYFQNPKKFTRLGGKLPRSVLLVGRNGTGKTMLARAVGKEASVPFFEYVMGRELEIDNKGLMKVFSAAKKQTPCMVFVDDINKSNLGLLQDQIDGFNQNIDGILVIGATSSKKLSDDSVIPAKFERIINLHVPCVKGRRELLESLMSNVVRGDDVNLAAISKVTGSFCADWLANLVNIAAVKAAMDGSEKVSMADLEHAFDRIVAGTELKSGAVRCHEELKNTAVHEAGHALVAIHVDGALPVHKATIVRRESALGMVIPEYIDGAHASKKNMLAELTVLMAGRAAEEVVFGEREVTSGAVSDIEIATQLARDMVTKYGMSPKIGLVYHDYDSSLLSSETRGRIDDEVKEFVEHAYKNAKNVLTDRGGELNALAIALLEHETLSGAQIKELLNR